MYFTFLETSNLYLLTRQAPMTWLHSNIVKNHVKSSWFHSINRRSFIGIRRRLYIIGFFLRDGLQTTKLKNSNAFCVSPYLRASNINYYFHKNVSHCHFPSFADGLVSVLPKFPILYP